MRSLRLVCAGAALCVATAGQAQLPSASTLRKQLDGYLIKPLPSSASIVGIPLPKPVPLLVIASLGDDGAVANIDRGYAVGRTLNDLLFGAHAKLDVETPFFYSLDVSDYGVPVGIGRDSFMNALRAGDREKAQWCAHGRVTGARPARLEMNVAACDSPDRVAARSFAVETDADWPVVLAAACEFVVGATGVASLPPRNGCARGSAIRPSSFLAYAKSAGSQAGLTISALEAIVAGDPGFAPAVGDLLWRLPYDGKRDPFLQRIRSLAASAAQSPAVVLLGLQRQLNVTGWKIGNHPYNELYSLIRTHPHLRGPWLVLATQLAEGTTYDYPPATAASEAPKAHSAGGHYPNEATHSAALAISLDIYAAWPRAYRSRWQLGYAMARYAWMLRGNEYWRDVPALGKKSFEPLMQMADPLLAAALDVNPAAATLWEARIGTLHHTGGDWRAAFERAITQHPRHQGLYEAAMQYSQGQWGGTEADRRRVEEAALKNNPGAVWPHTLRARHLPPEGRVTA